MFHYEMVLELFGWLELESEAHIDVSKESVVRIHLPKELDGDGKELAKNLVCYLIDHCAYFNTYTNKSVFQFESFQVRVTQ